MADLEPWVSHFTRAPRVPECEGLSLEAAKSVVADMGWFAAVIEVPTPDNFGIHLDARPDRVYLIAANGRVERAYRT